MRLFVALLLAAIAVPAIAQSPNTSILVVCFADQTGGVVSDAKGYGDQQRHLSASRGGAVECCKGLGQHHRAVVDGHL